jgi:glycosyltransferase involved in cell wall biosynthesis
VKAKRPTIISGSLLEVKSMNALSVVLHGPHPSAGGGVLAFCNTLELGLKQPTLEVSRLYIGSATGDQTTGAGAVAGIKALVGSFPDVFRAASGRRVVHFNTSFTQKALMRDAVFLKIAQARGCPTVVEFHGGLPESYEDRGSRWALRTLVKADQLVVINPQQGAQLVERFPETSNKVHLIPNSVEIPNLDLGERWSARQLEPRVLFLSRLEPAKGLLETIRALALVRDRGVRIGLDIAGTGTALEEAQALVKELKLEDVVVFHGTVAGEAKQALFRNATLFSFPTYYPEGQPIVVLEAFAWGLPVITSTLEPTAGLVPHGVNGLHVPPRDPEAIASAITQLVSDHRLNMKIAQANRARAESEFDIRQNSHRFVALYQQAVYQRAAGRQG